MLNPTDLQDRLVELLRAIPELVSEVGDTGSIQAYDDESLIDGDADLTAASMLGKAVLVVWTGAECPRAGETRGWTHKFTIFLEAPDIRAYHRLAQIIIDGVPTPPDGDGHASFIESDVPGTDGIQEVELAVQPGSDGDPRLALSFSITEQ